MEAHRTHRHSVELLAMLLDCIGYTDCSLLAKVPETVLYAFSQVANCLIHVIDLQVRLPISCIHASPCQAACLVQQFVSSLLTCH